MEKFITGAALGMLAGALLTANNYKMRTLVRKGQEEVAAKLDQMLDEKIELLEKGVLNDPLEVDEHDIHVNEHIVFMLGNEFDRHSKRTPKIVEQMLRHIRMHKKFKSITTELENKGE